MAPHGTQCSSMEAYRTRWNPTGHCRNLLNLVEPCRTIINLVEPRRIPWSLTEPRRTFLNYFGLFWNLALSNLGPNVQDIRSLFGTLEKKNCSRPGVFFFEPRRTSQNLIERCGTSRTCRILHSPIQPYEYFFFGSTVQSFETLQNVFDNLQKTLWHLQIAKKTNRTS